MKFSICLSTGYEGLVYPVNFCAPQDLVRQGQLAEKLGFHSVWGNDHITPPNYVRDHFKDSPNFYDVLITLAMIHIDNRVAMAITMFIFSTGIAVCLVLLMVYDRPYGAGGFVVQPTVLRDIMPD